MISKYIKYFLIVVCIIQSSELHSSLPAFEERLRKLETESFPRALTHAAHAYEKGSTINTPDLKNMKLEHSISFTPSAFFGVASFLSLSSTFHGMYKYWNAHRNGSHLIKNEQYIKTNKEAAASQIAWSVGGLVCSLIGLWYYTPSPITKKSI